MTRIFKKNVEPFFAVRRRTRTMHKKLNSRKKLKKKNGVRRKRR